MAETEFILEEDSFKIIIETTKRLLGFETDKYNDNFLKRRLLTRLRATNTSNYEDYEKILTNSKKEQEELLINLTIHVTEFFRDDSFWIFCKETFFPEILNTFSDKNKINFWSAGCSNGQEAISILITFLEINPNLKSKINITCSDIDKGTINKASGFIYQLNELKGLEDERLVEKYFDKTEHFIQLKKEFHNNFNFVQHDILKDEPLRKMDALFLRNTVIYFSKEAKEDLYLKLYNTLNPYSFFVLGKTETLGGEARDLFKIFDPRERIFVKK